ncbi:MAG: alpha/beta hydrolase [Rhodospirillales bacterium]|nr:alpha/beta hydrolase [Rhodospirillales bacterium]
MIDRRLRVLGPVGFRDLVYSEWGDPKAARTLVCVHGLTRCRHDFDTLADALADAYRVVSIDVAGRGESDWLPDKGHYDFPLYMADLAALIARLDVEAVDWLGTSMGGLIGLFLAAQARAPIRTLILNDVGARLEAQSLKRISAYVAWKPRFETLDVAEAHFREIHAPFGRLTDAQWRRLAQTSTRPHPEGGLTFHYDPKIGERFKEAPADKDVELWSYWEPIAIPTLVLRGAQSDLLSAATVVEMQRRNARCDAVDIEGCGHAPGLMAPDQIALVRDWLERHPG